MTDKDATLSIEEAVNAATEALKRGDFKRSMELSRYAERLAKAKESAPSVPSDVQEMAVALVSRINPAQTIGKVGSGDNKGKSQTARNLYNAKEGTGVWVDPISGDTFGLALHNLSETERRDKARTVPVIGVPAVETQPAAE